MITVVPKITDEGVNLTLRNVGGEQITFTKFQLGKGTIETDGTELKSLVKPVMNRSISEIDSKSLVGAIKLSCVLDFAAIEEDFKWTEIGIFCKGEDGKEILYAYSNDAENAGSIRKDMDGIVGTLQLAFIIAMSSTDNVSAIVSGSLLYATKDELNGHVDRRDNPHKVTAYQVGLGNVPNVSTNDQAPTYDYSKNLLTLTSGEKLSIAFGKIAKAVKDFIDHLRASNPHNLDASDVKAASEVHEHSAADITKGLLPFERGGTNVGSLAALRNSIITTYTYQGDGSSSREIVLGYRPRAVLITDLCGRTSCLEENGRWYTYGGLALDGFNASSFGDTFSYGAGLSVDTAIQITANGFVVRYGRKTGNTQTSGDGLDQVRTNAAWLWYHAVIIK